MSKPTKISPHISGAFDSHADNILPFRQPLPSYRDKSGLQAQRPQHTQEQIDQQKKHGSDLSSFIAAFKILPD